LDRFWSLLFLAVPVLGLVIVIGAASGTVLQNAWLPESIGPRTEGIDYLFNLVHVILGIVFGGTGLVLAWCLFRFSARRRTRASRTHSVLWLELVWTAIPAAVLVFLAFHQLPYWQDNKQNHPAFLDAQQDGTSTAGPLARVVAYQFGWRFVYPGPDEVLDTRDDVISENLLVLPCGEEVVLELVSEDVIHSFAVNKLRLKQDMVPGLTPRIWFMVDREGDWEINCMELCGWGHFRMSARMRTLSRPRYEDWLSSQMEVRGY
jgi:cytochrome c oxidase subunit 2